jgi:RNA polymerase sigma factor (sigma-70 family)
VSEPLLPRVAAGESDAVAACLDRYANLVWSLARRYTSSQADAEDAVQEIFIDLWSSAGRYDPGKASETTFVAMIARRRLIDRLRKDRREPGMEELEHAQALDEPGPSARVEARDEAARASRLIRTLKPEQQQVIKMAVYDGQTHQSIADTLGMPLGTVKTHLRRGLMRIRGAMQTPVVATGRESLP